MAAHGDGAHVFAVINAQAPQCRAAEGMSLFQDRVEYWSEIARRGVDNPQHLGGGGLLLQRLARLINETCVLHRDHRLRREVFEQRDLLVGEWPHLLSLGADLT